MRLDGDLARIDSYVIPTLGVVVGKGTPFEAVERRLCDKAVNCNLLSQQRRVGGLWQCPASVTFDISGSQVRGLRHGSPEFEDMGRRRL